MRIHVCCRQLNYLTLLAVVSAAVSVICELARKNASNYIAMAPTLFKLLMNTSNKWMKLKILKLVWR